MFRKSRKSKDQTEVPASFNLSIDNQPMIAFPSELIESVRYLATRLMYKKTFPSRFALVSALREEGVTFVSRAMGAVLANDTEKKVCVVELNWWWSDASITKDNHSAGLADVLVDKVSINDVLLPTNIPNLKILSAGKMAKEDRPVFARSDQLTAVIDELGEQFEYLVLDVPSILATNDAIPLASLASACGLVINQGVTSIENVRLALDEIDHLSVSGVVLNKVKRSTPSWILKYIPQDPVPVSYI
jgi:MinD-like ATPase involved in chromosome partitioning or flagellar assembly